MAEDETKPNRVDFARGIPLDDLPDGGMLVGHVTPIHSPPMPYRAAVSRLGWRA